MLSTRDTRVEPPHHPLGLQLPEKIYFPAYDKSLPADQIGAVFDKWVGNFYLPYSNLPSDVDIIASRPAMHDLEGTERRFFPTVSQLTPQELDGWVDGTVMERSARCIHTADLKVWRDNAERALFDCPPDGALRHVDVLALWGNMTVPVCIFAMSELCKRFQQNGHDGKIVRKSTVVKLDGCNHFVSVCTLHLWNLLDYLSHNSYRCTGTSPTGSCRPSRTTCSMLSGAPSE